MLIEMQSEKYIRRKRRELHETKKDSVAAGADADPDTGHGVTVSAVAEELLTDDGLEQEGETFDILDTSSNKKVVTVTSKGVVKGIRKGTATVTVRSGSVVKTCKVTVK